VEINIHTFWNSTLNTGNNVVHVPAIYSSGEESRIRRIAVWQTTSLYRLGSFIIDGAGMPWSDDHSLEDHLLRKWYSPPLVRFHYIKGMDDNIKYAKVENIFDLKNCRKFRTNYSVPKCSDCPSRVFIQCTSHLWYSYHRL